jgi:hypothetical protein
MKQRQQRKRGLHYVDVLVCILMSILTVSS